MDPGGRVTPAEEQDWSLAKRERKKLMNILNAVRRDAREGKNVLWQQSPEAYMHHDRHLADTQHEWNDAKRDMHRKEGLLERLQVELQTLRHQTDFTPEAMERIPVTTEAIEQWHAQHEVVEQRREACELCLADIQTLILHQKVA
eukprot:jgi/Chlat1/7060/Chrsp56S06712